MLRSLIRTQNHDRMILEHQCDGEYNEIRSSFKKECGQMGGNGFRGSAQRVSSSGSLDRHTDCSSSSLEQNSSQNPAADSSTDSAPAVTCSSRQTVKIVVDNE